jgi:hypothetical protein
MLSGANLFGPLAATFLELTSEEPIDLDCKTKYCKRSLSYLFKFEDYYYNIFSACLIKMPPFPSVLKCPIPPEVIKEPGF